MMYDKDHEALEEMMKRAEPIVYDAAQTVARFAQFVPSEVPDEKTRKEVKVILEQDGLIREKRDCQWENRKRGREMEL